MKLDDLIHILCRLTSKYYDFDTEQSAVVYEFSGRKYEISFKRIQGVFSNFTVQDAGEVVKCES